MVAADQGSIVCQVEGRIVQLVVGREWIKSQRSIGASANTAEDVHSREHRSAVGTVFDLLVIGSDKLVGNPVLEVGAQFQHSRTGIVLDDVSSVLS